MQVSQMILSSQLYPASATYLFKNKLGIDSVELRFFKVLFENNIPISY